MFAADAYFELIVKSIYDFQGDVQKYSGDALFAAWRKTDHRTLDDCVFLASVCACNMTTVLGDHPVSVRTGVETLTVKMNLHCGIGCGGTVGIHIGDNNRVREFLQ